eukprot:SAG22_NODE_1636_length_3923_cov_3.294195_3_plen_997_part_00
MYVQDLNEGLASDEDKINFDESAADPVGAGWGMDDLDAMLLKGIKKKARRRMILTVALVVVGCVCSAVVMHKVVDPNMGGRTPIIAPGPGKCLTAFPVPQCAHTTGCSMQPPTCSYTGTKAQGNCDSCAKGKDPDGPPECSAFCTCIAHCDKPGVVAANDTHGSVVGPGLYARSCGMDGQWGPAYAGNAAGVGACIDTSTCGPDSCGQADKKGACDVYGKHCVCTKGYEGTDCQTETDYCSPSPCQNGGRCDYHHTKASIGMGVYECTCGTNQATGKPFGGTNCAEQDDLCFSNPCLNGGSCTQEDGERHCQCAGGFGGPTCLTDTSAPVVCTADGFNGGHAIDSSSVVTANTTYYEIACDPGFAAVGSTKYECDLGSWVSVLDGTSSPADAGLQCNDYDECGSHPCAPNGNCTESSVDTTIDAGTYSCTCAGTWSGDNCGTDLGTKRDPCADSHPCQHGATCDVVDSGFTCACTIGYEGDECADDKDECNSTPCQNGGVCSESGTTPVPAPPVPFGEYRCACGSFHGDNCEVKADPCAANPCEHGGTCTAQDGGFSCTCNAAATGATCGVDADPCTSGPCQNNGTCQHTPFTAAYTCDCSTATFPGDGSRYNGPLCDQTTATHPFNTDPCASSPCVHGACNPDDHNSSTFACTCTDAYSGPKCEIEKVTDPCASTPCAHGAGDNQGCTTAGTAYTCTCVLGYAGDNCDSDINECESAPCKHGSTCLESGSDPAPDPAVAFGVYRCECGDTGYSGDNCNADTDDCSSSPCQNGGVCTDAGNKAFTCACAHFEGGDMCEITACMHNPQPGWGTAGGGGECTPCGQGKHPKPDNTGCVTCPHGKYGTAAGKCNKNCGPNEQTNDEGTACTACGPGETVKNKVCKACTPGKHEVGGSCTQCGQGKYTDGDHPAAGNNNTCYNCPKGKSPAANHNACNLCTGVKATWQTPGKCDNCPDGKAPGKDRDTCADCGDGKAGKGGQCRQCDGGTSVNTTTCGSR